MRPVDLAREHGQTMLVVEYTGGTPLDRLVRQPMEIGQLGISLRYPGRFLERDSWARMMSAEPLPAAGASTR